jgi:hypothetical protein
MLHVGILPTLAETPRLRPSETWVGATRCVVSCKWACCAALYIAVIDGEDHRCDVVISGEVGGSGKGESAVGCILPEEGFRLLQLISSRMW